MIFYKYKWFNFKVNPIIRPKAEETTKIKPKEKAEPPKTASNFLEVDDSKKIDLANIVNDNNNKLKVANGKIFEGKKTVKDRENSPSFVDDSSVPPLE